MAIIKKACQFCGKTSDITSELDLGTSRMITFKCGHTVIEEKITESQITLATEQQVKSLYQELKEAKPEWCEKHQRNCIKTIESRTGKHLFPFQRDGVIKAIDNNAKFIFADEMGLGKTAQILVTILLMPEKLLPCIFVCKAIARTNMFREVMDILEVPAQVMTSSSETPYEMFKVHILSYDGINRLDKLFKFSDMRPQIECPECNYRMDLEKNPEGFCPECNKVKHTQQNKQETQQVVENGVVRTITRANIVQIAEKKLEKVKMVPYVDKSIGVGTSLRDQNKAQWSKIIARCQTIILDETHLIKNEDAQRTKAVRELCRLIPHKLLASGTLTKNNATEYFVPCNIVFPERYWRQNAFNMAHCRMEYVKSAISPTGYAKKYTGLKDPEAFKEETSHFLIRRTVDEVLPELPKLWKQQKFVELDEAFQEVYDESEKDFVEWFESAGAKEIQLNLLAKLAILRHQTSLAKIDYTLDLVLEFLMSSDRKLAIFTHHIDAREILADKLAKFLKETEQHPDTLCVLTQDTKTVQDEIEAFKNNPNARIILLSTLSHGESINLQFMRDSILHERQWNAANEDQAISGRFRRIGQTGDSLTCQIPVALGTIDEHYVDLIEMKRAIGKELDTGEIESFNTNFASELASMICDRGRKRWKL